MRDERLGLCRLELLVSHGVPPFFFFFFLSLSLFFLEKKKGERAKNEGEIQLDWL